MTGKDMISKICKFAYVMSIVGVCTLGICPAFAMMSLAVSIVLKSKNADLDEMDIRKLKRSKILSAVSLALFAADIVIAYVLFV